MLVEDEVDEYVEVGDGDLAVAVDVSHIDKAFTVGVGNMRVPAVAAG